MEEPIVQENSYTMQWLARFLNRVAELTEKLCLFICGGLQKQARLVHPDKNPNDPTAAHNFQVSWLRWRTLQCPSPFSSSNFQVLQMPVVQCILYKLMLIYRAEFKWCRQTYQIVSKCLRKIYTNSAAVTTMQFSCAAFWILSSSSGNSHLDLRNYIYVWFSCCHAL